MVELKWKSFTLLKKPSITTSVYFYIYEYEKFNILNPRRITRENQTNLKNKGVLFIYVF